MKKKMVRARPDNELKAMKRAAQARDRALAAEGKLAAGDVFLIQPEQARRAKLKWPVARLCD